MIIFIMKINIMILKKIKFCLRKLIEILFIKEVINLFDFYLRLLELW